VYGRLTEGIQKDNVAIDGESRWAGLNDSYTPLPVIVWPDEKAGPISQENHKEGEAENGGI
jgi:hypothetical protein